MMRFRMLLCWMRMWRIIGAARALGLHGLVRRFSEEQGGIGRHLYITYGSCDALLWPQRCACI